MCLTMKIFAKKMYLQRLHLDSRHLVLHPLLPPLLLLDPPLCLGVGSQGGSVHLRTLVSLLNRTLASSFQLGLVLASSFELGVLTSMPGTSWPRC